MASFGRLSRRQGPDIVVEHLDREAAGVPVSLDPSEQGGEVEDALAGQDSLAAAVTQLAWFVPHVIQMDVPDPRDRPLIEVLEPRHCAVIQRFS